MSLLLPLLRLKWVHSFINWPQLYSRIKKRYYQGVIWLYHTSLMCVQSPLWGKAETVWTINRSRIKTMQVKESLFSVVVSNSCHAWKMKSSLKTNPAESWELFVSVAGAGRVITTHVQTRTFKCYRVKINKFCTQLKAATVKRAYFVHAFDAATVRTLSIRYSIAWTWRSGRFITFTTDVLMSYSPERTSSASSFPPRLMRTGRYCWHLPPCILITWDTRLLTFAVGSGE